MKRLAALLHRLAYRIHPTPHVVTIRLDGRVLVDALIRPEGDR